MSLPPAAVWPPCETRAGHSTDTCTFEVERRLVAPVTGSCKNDELMRIEIELDEAGAGSGCLHADTAVLPVEESHVRPVGTQSRVDNHAILTGSNRDVIRHQDFLRIQQP